MRQSGPPAPPGPGPGGGADSARTYFATPGHYRAVAERVGAALQGLPGVVLVAGDPPPEAAMLAPALTGIAPRWRVIARSCTPELDVTALRQAAAGAAAEAAGSIAVARLRPPPPLFVLDAAERLSEPQLTELLTARAADDAAIVLLAGAGFGRRLAAPAAADQRPVVSLRFDELGGAEVDGFIRHQLGAAGAFPPEIVSVIAKAAGGDPALVERLARLVLGFAGGAAEMPAASLLLRPAALAAKSAPPETIAAPKGTRTRLRRALFAGLGLAAALAAAAIFLERGALEPAAPTAPAGAAAGFSEAELKALLERGDRFRAAGDIASARLFYERAAEAGSAAAALRLGDSYDPARLARAGVRGAGGDIDRARAWYRRAQALGEAAAAARLEGLAAATGETR